MNGLPSAPGEGTLRRSARVAALAVVVAAAGLPGGAATAAAAHRAALPGVTFLPPVGSGPAPSAAFDPDADLRVEIFALAADGAIGLRAGPSFSVAQSSGQRIKVNAGGREPQYHANWKTSDSRRPDGSMVRVEIRLPSAPAGPACNAGTSLAGGCIGYFDVALRKGNKGGSWPAGVMVLTNGQTLPIKVHIADGALDAPPASQLPGAPGSAATAAIPDLDYEFSPDDYTPHPDLGGLMVTHDILLLVLALDTTVAQANALFAEIGGQIIGGIPGQASASEGIVLLRVPTASHSEMDALLDRLASDPRVSVAVQDSLLEADEVPAPVVDPAGWTWEVTPGGANWGLEAMRVPQLWNLNRALAKTGRTAVTGVLDSGFADHPDLVYTVNMSPGPGGDPDHGTHVAGTIAALYDNGDDLQDRGIKGVDGVNPFAELVVQRYNLTIGGIGGWGVYDFLERMPDIQLVNLSLGNNWAKKAQDPAINTKAQKLVLRQALVFVAWQEVMLAKGRRLPLLVGSAGNDSGNVRLFGADVDARWNAPWTYASLVYGVQNVIVVEAVGLDPSGGSTRASFSNLNGHVSAPGKGIVSTGPDPWLEPYKTMSGTSMATPHVTGLAGYLMSLDPTLTPTEVRGLIWSTALPVNGGASDGVDAFAAALAIDGLRGNSAILMRLLDIDDGTPDGGLRMDCAQTCTEFPSEDADGDGGRGDGVIDMSDFRRWRDMLLRTEVWPDLALDGWGNLKLDVNGNGVLEFPAQENIYPDGDFNGDGVLDRDDVRYVPGRVNLPATDLEVLQTLFEDEHYSASDLPELIDSADIHVDASGCLSTPGAERVRATILEAATSDWVDERDFEDPGSFVFTVPLAPGGHVVRLEVRDGNGNVAGVAQSSFATALGSDSWYAPVCGRILLDPPQINVVLNSGESETYEADLISEGLAASWEIIGSVAHVEPAISGGTIASGGQAAIDPTVTCPARPGGYGGFLDLEFRDLDGNVIETGVPEWLVVDIVCLEGGVVLEPEALQIRANPGESISRMFRLTNKGTALLYGAQPGAHLSIAEDATGLLPERRDKFVTVTATCPQEPGDYSTSVALAFEREDGEPVTVDVPESLQVDLECWWIAPLRIIDQIHENSVFIQFPTQYKSEHYHSFDESGTAFVQRTEFGDGDPSDITTAIEPIGFGSVSSSISLSGSHDFSLDPLIGGVRTRSSSSSLAFESTVGGPVPTVTFAGEISQTYDQSLLMPFLQTIDGDHARTSVIFDLLEPAEVVANWSCNGECEISLERIGGAYVFRSWVDQSFAGSIPPGRYRFWASNQLRYFVTELHKTAQASYEMSITFGE